jgi:RND superfamily putative drug exporter
MEKWANWTSRLRWVVLALWIAIAAVSVLALPNLQDIVRKTEQKFLPADSESLQAGKLIDQINPRLSCSAGMAGFSRPTLRG